MRISENSFNILDVSLYESKNIIIDKFNNKLELEPEEKDFYDEHRHNLLLSSGRLKQEIRWFHSYDLKSFENFRNDIGLFENKAFQMNNPLSSINLLIYTKV